MAELPHSQISGSGGSGDVESPGLGFQPGIPSLPERPANPYKPQTFPFGDPAGRNGVKIQGIEEVFHVQENPGMHTQLLMLGWSWDLGFVLKIME